MKRKRRAPRLQFRKAAPEYNLLVAAAHFLESMGGKAIVLGGTEIQKSPGDPPGKFKLAVSIAGSPPNKKVKP